MCARPRLGDTRRAQLLDATVEVISDRGFHATRLEDVASRVGLHPSTILHHVGSKHELLCDALEHAERRFFDYVRMELAKATSSVEKLQLVITCSSSPPPELADYALWLDIWSVARTNAQVHETRVTLDAEWRAILERIVEEGQSAGELGGPPPPLAALAIAALLDGLAIPVTLGNPAVSAARMEEVAFEAISRIVAVPLAHMCTTAGSVA